MALPGGPRDVVGHQPVAGELLAGVEHPGTGPDPVRGEDGQTWRHRQVPAERDGDVLAVHPVVDGRLAAGDGRQRPPHPDPVADLADEDLDGQFGVAARHRADRAVHAPVADQVEHGPRHRRPGRVLQCQVRRHLPDRPALAQRRLAPLLLGQVFKQVHQGAPLIVDCGPHLAGFHRFLRSRPAAGPLPGVVHEMLLRVGHVRSLCAGVPAGRTRDSSSAVILSEGSNPGSGMASWCSISPVM